jgi:hypothetical protein
MNTNRAWCCCPQGAAWIFSIPTLRHGPTTILRSVVAHLSLGRIFGLGPAIVRCARCWRYARHRPVTVRRTLNALNPPSGDGGTANGRDPLKLMCGRLSKFKDNLIPPTRLRPRSKRRKGTPLI